MWSKTILGFVVSLLLNTSLMFNFGFIAPIPEQVFLLIGYVGGFMLWGAIMTVFYCSNSLKKPLLYTLPILGFSAGINTLYVMGIVS